MTKSKEDEAGVAATLHDTYEKVSDKVATAYASARGKASEAAGTTASGIESNPLVALLGGLAIGAVAGALVPRSAKEGELLAPLGGRIADAARAAFAAARDAGNDALGEAGLAPDNLREQAGKAIEQLLKAAGSAGTAAFSAARDASTK